MSEKIYKEAWDYTMKVIHDLYKSQNKEDEFKIWFNMSYVEDTIDTITISVASNFLRQMIQKKGYFDVVQNKLKEITGQNDITLNCIIKEELISNSNSKNDSEIKTVESKKSEEKKSVQSSAEIESKPLEENPKSDKKSENKKHPLLQEEYTFETFIPGDNSNFAYNASIAVAKNPGKQYNPILLYGGSGLGKTHLMQAIGNYIYNNGGEKLKICYVSAESFTNEFIFSTKEGKTNAFKNKYRNLDVLLLDDIHFLQGKESTQEEFHNTFNALYENGKQIVISSDKPPKDIHPLEERLRSRFEWGLIADIGMPDYETRLAILRKKAAQDKIIIDDNILINIATKVDSNIRELEGVLNKLIAQSSLTGEEITDAMAEHAIKDVSTKQKNVISVAYIQEVIANYFDIKISDLKSQKRSNDIAFPRQIAMYLCREILNLSLPKIGEAFGRRDHTTVMFACNKIKKEIHDNTETKLIVDNVNKILNQS